MQKLRKLLALALVVCTSCAVGVMVWSQESTSAVHSNPQSSVDLVELYEHPENSPNTELIIHKDVNDYITALNQDENLSPENKAALIRDAMDTPIGSAVYVTVRQAVTVTDNYSAYPYFYILLEPSASTSSAPIIEVKSANLDRNHGEISKQFAGELYYNLESATSLYWDLNGDFYNNETATVSRGAGVKIGEAFSLSFSVSSTSNHYGYVQATGNFSLPLASVGLSSTTSKPDTTVSGEADNAMQAPTNPPPSDREIVDEMTVKVVDKDGKPVPNIGVYGNPSQSIFLISSTISHAVTDNEGIAILQRVRTGQIPNEVVTVGLADRNQSDSIQQKSTISMPDSGSAYEPQAVAWNKTLPIDYLKKQTNAITLTIVNTEGEALPNIWVKLGLPSRTAADGSNNDMGYQEDLPFADRYLITGSDGTCTFSNVGKGSYSIGLWGGAPPFNLVSSENPLLQAEVIYSDKSTWGTTIDYTEGGKQAFTLEFIPHVSQ